MNNLIAAVQALGGVIIPAVGANVTGAPPGGSTKWATLSISGSDHHHAAGTSEFGSPTTAQDHRPVLRRQDQHGLPR
jgi:hypothetical protein